MRWLVELLVPPVNSIVLYVTIPSVNISWVKLQDKNPDELKDLSTLAAGTCANSQAVGSSKVEPGNESRTTVKKPVVLEVL